MRHEHLHASPRQLAATNPHNCPPTPPLHTVEPAIAPLSIPTAFLPSYSPPRRRALSRATLDSPSPSRLPDAPPTRPPRPWDPNWPPPPPQNTHRCRRVAPSRYTATSVCVVDLFSPWLRTSGTDTRLKKRRQTWRSWAWEHRRRDCPQWMVKPPSSNMATIRAATASPDDSPMSPSRPPHTVSRCETVQIFP